jgi:hypothetical protein
MKFGVEIEGHSITFSLGGWRIYVKAGKISKGFHELAFQVWNLNELK